MRYYYLFVWGGVEATAYGPFDTTDERDAAAKEFWDGQSNRDENSIFRMNVNEIGHPIMESYLSGELDDIDEYATQAECKTSGQHMKSVDGDGYCNGCGTQFDEE